MVYSIAFFIRGSHMAGDMMLVQAMLSSLRKCSDVKLIAYNQGVLPNNVVELLMRHNGIDAVVLGQGENIGIAKARQATFEYAWENMPDEPYICEIHPDMLLFDGWERPIIAKLEAMDEPMMSAGIIDANGKLYPPYTGDAPLCNPKEETDLVAKLPAFARDELRMGFNNPVIYRSEAIKAIGGYDTRFLTGKQEFEDTSIMLGFMYYMGTRVKWRPKAYLGSIVFHSIEAQRIGMPDMSAEVERNFAGLCRQYGAYGLKELLDMNPYHRKISYWFDQMCQGTWPIAP